jgi:hypothetical protein
MLDWFIWFSPIAVLLIIYLFGFTGCLVTDRIWFTPFIDFTVTFPADGTDDAMIEVVWESGTMAHHSQGLDSAQFEEAGMDRRRVRWTTDLLPSGQWSVGCLFRVNGAGDPLESELESRIITREQWITARYIIELEAGMLVQTSDIEVS